MDYQSRNVLADPELREAIKKFSNWPTIPQVQPKHTPAVRIVYCLPVCPAASSQPTAVLTSWAAVSQCAVACCSHLRPHSDSIFSLHGFVDVQSYIWHINYTFRLHALLDVQLYIKGEFVGGSDILMGLHRSGDLRTLLSDGPKEHTAA